MASNLKEITHNFKNPITVVKWCVNEGEHVSIGSILFHYQEYNENGECNDKQLKFRSRIVGTVHKVIVQEQSSKITKNEVLLQLASCKHPTVMKDLCAECGADLRKEEDEIHTDTNKASVSMIHSVPELKVSKELALQLGKADEERLLKARKLVLLVDLDQTLIHTTNDNIPNNIKDVFHFQLYGQNSPWYHTRLRPGTMNFLENVSKLYELHICTFGVRTYAHMIASILDSDGKYFSHRILSRDECFNPLAKTANLKALFPCGDSMVCIIDDREDVWSYSPNLIPVKPYHFFQHTGDINAPPGLDKTEQDSDDEEDNLLSRVIKSALNRKTCNDTQKMSKFSLKTTQNSLKSSDVEAKSSNDGSCNIKDTINETVKSIVKSVKETDEVNDCIDDEIKLNVGQSDSVNESISEAKESEKPECQSKLESVSDAKESERPECQSKLESVSDAKESEKPECQSKLESVSDAKESEKPEYQSKLESILSENDSKNITELNEDCKDKVSEDSEESSELDKKLSAKNGTDFDKILSDYSTQFNKNKKSFNKKKKVTINVETNKKYEESEKSSDVSADEIKLDCQPTAQNSDSTVEAKKSDVTDSVIDIEDNDDYLLYLEDILNVIHKAYFKIYDQTNHATKPDMKNVIPYVRLKILKSINIVFSGIIPTNMKMEKHKAYVAAKSLGANVQTKLMSSEMASDPSEISTHLIAAHPGTAKVIEARKIKGIKIVNLDWLWNCSERWEHVEEKLFPLKKVTSTKNSPVSRQSPLLDLSKQIGQSFTSSVKYEKFHKKLNNKSDKDISSEANNFASSYNPLLAFSTDDIAKMDQEVEDIFNEEGSDSDDAESENLSKNFDGNLSSDESLSGDRPHGWKQNESEQWKDFVMKSNEIEEHSSSHSSSESEGEPRNKYQKLEKSDQINNDSDTGSSIGSVDEEMAAAIEKELLDF